MWRFEQLTTAAESPLPAVIGGAWATVLWLGAAILFSILAATYSTLLAPLPLLFTVIIALLTARMMIIDLNHHLLPDIYTAPLLLGGLLFHATQGSLGFVDSFMAASCGFVLPLLFILLCARVLNLNSGFGGGDIKLTAAAAAWCGTAALPWLVALACIIGIALSFILQRNKEIPFGPALVMSLWILLIVL